MGFASDDTLAAIDMKVEELIDAAQTAARRYSIPARWPRLAAVVDGFQVTAEIDPDGEVENDRWVDLTSYWAEAVGPDGIVHRGRFSGGEVTWGAE